MVKKLIESDNLEVEELEKPEEMNIDNTKFKEMYVYDPKNKTIKTVVQKKQTRKHFNEDKMKEHMEKMRLARQSKIKAKKQPQPQPQPQSQQQPTQQSDLTNIRDLIRSELLNHLPKPKAPAEPEETPKKIEVEKVRPKRSRRPVHTSEPQVQVENKNIEVPKSFIPPQNYVSPSFSIFGY
jgi:hypothetical protein